jgi:hypothetical protein
MGVYKMFNTAALPAPSVDAGLSKYLVEIRKFPLLKPEQELACARRWREHRDRDAAYQLVTSHLRLVAKIAMRYRGYHLHACRQGAAWKPERREAPRSNIPTRSGGADPANDHPIMIGRSGVQ